jgi:hypothetical protein
MSQQYKYSLRQLQWFINEDLKSKGVQFDDSSSNFLFNTAVIINETETINNLAISKDMISEKSLLEHHPWVKNVEQEIQEIEKDRQEQMQKDLELAEKTAQIEKKYEATHHHSTTN